MRCSRARNKGFTFVELMIVAVITALVSLAVFSLLRAGLAVWYKVQQPLEEEGVTFFLEKFDTDFSNAVVFTGVPFKGTDTICEVPTLVRGALIDVPTIGQVRYRYDEGEKRLYRQQVDYSQLYEDRQPYVEQSMAQVRSARFKYLIYDPQKKELGWYDEVEGGMPLAVSLEMVTGAGAGQLLRKTVTVPVSHIPEK